MSRYQHVQYDQLRTNSQSNLHSSNQVISESESETESPLSNQSSYRTINQSRQYPHQSNNHNGLIDEEIVYDESRKKRKRPKKFKQRLTSDSDDQTINRALNQLNTQSNDHVHEPHPEPTPTRQSHHQIEHQTINEYEEEDSDGPREQASLLRNSSHRSINQPNHRISHSPARPHSSINQSHSIQIAQSPSIGNRTVSKQTRSLSINQPANEKAPLSLIIGISLYWFGWSALNFPLLVVIIPMQARMFAESMNQSTYQPLIQPANIGSALSQTLMLGSVLSAIAGPLFGSYSDSSQSVNGRRRPFLLFGTFVLTISLIGLAQSTNLSTFAIFFIFFSIANSAIISPYAALVPDLIDRKQRGQASGWLGFFSMAGNLFGGAVSAYVGVIGIPLTYCILMIVHNLAMYGTLRLIDEKPLVYDDQSISQSNSIKPQTPRHFLSRFWPIGGNDHSLTSPSQHSVNQLSNQRPPTGFRRFFSLFSPFFNHDFRVVFIVRFLFQMGCLTVQEFLLFYLHDQIGQQPIHHSADQLTNSALDFNFNEAINPAINQTINHNERIFTVNGVILATSSEQAITLLFIPVMFGALISSLISGMISDSQTFNLSKKSIVYYSGWLMILVAVMFSVTRSYGISLVLGGMFGIGFGAFSTMEWALCTDVLPNPIEFAKDMGIWSLALVVPQILAVPIAGHLLDFAASHGHHTLGYSAIFLAAAGYFTLGTFAVKKLEAGD